MLDQQNIIPHIRTFHIENRPRIKISLIDEKSKFEINRIFMPIESNEQNSMINIPSSDEPILNRDSSLKTQQIMNIIDHREKEGVTAYNHGEHFQPSIDLITEHSPSSSKVSIEQLNISTNKTDTPSVIRVEQPLSPPISQLIPDSIINDKQATNRIFNEKNSTHFTHPSKFITLTPINSSSKSIDDDLSSSNQIRYYQLGSIFTSTSTFLMHQNNVIAHATASDPFFSDTIFIILIATLTIIILLFCLGLFCLCRRTNKRNISPSFDGGSYAGLNDHSYSIPINDYPQQNSKYENNIPLSSIQTRSSINQPISTNDRIPIALHQTAKQKMNINNKKLKKKRVGFCCCNSKQTPSTTINARTRMQE